MRKLEGRATVSNAEPRVIRLTDSGVRKVVLSFKVDAFTIDLELKDPELVQREIIRAVIWAEGDDE